LKSESLNHSKTTSKKTDNKISPWHLYNLINVRPIQYINARY
jgi:hypothetical protein